MTLNSDAHQGRAVATGAATVCLAGGALTAALADLPSVAAVLSPAGLIPGLVLAALALCVVAAVRDRDVSVLLIGGAIAALAIVSLFGPAWLPGPRQYLLALACIGGAFATSRLRTRFVEPADVLILLAAAVLLLALGGQAVTF